jgi:uncharacterized protein YbaA (DUF1428 family)
MPKYIDGFVIPVPQAKLETYRKIARKACKVWMEYGALDYVETVGDDLSIQGITATFPKTIKLKPGEVVVFSYIVYKSRAHRDKVNGKVMKDPRIKGMCNEKDMPFNPKRMSYGGFKSIVEA